LAKEVSQLQELCIRMSEADSAAEEERAKYQPGENFRCVEKSAFERDMTLRRLILQLEPTTASEILSLALVFYSEFEQFCGQHTNHSDPDIERKIKRMERATKAIIRGLIFTVGTSSPLIPLFLGQECLMTWQEARSEAGRWANLQLIEYDPIEGRLTSKAARRQCQPTGNAH
jgi:hypothetical protein